jgi:hypothetical protein
MERIKKHTCINITAALNMAKRGVNVLSGTTLAHTVKLLTDAENEGKTYYCHLGCNNITKEGMCAGHGMS